jgi:hypothetical protein
VIENHGGGEHEHQPLDAEREEAGVLELRVDGSDKDGARQEAGDEVAGDEQKNAPTAWVR